MRLLRLLPLVIGVLACEPATPPNILLVTLDTTRPDRLGVYGAANPTPTLERFAQDAVVYERAYASSSWTLPSHASLFTGLLPIQHGAQTAADGNTRALGYTVRPLGERFETLAERLHAAGYRTAAFVGGPALRRDLGLAQGFEQYGDSLHGLEVFGGRRAAAVVDDAIAALQGFESSPWFLFVNLFDPHAPYDPPAPYNRGLEKVDELRLNQTRIDRLVAGRPVAPEPWEVEANAALLARYDAEIAYVDAELARLLAAAAAVSGGARTLVAITSDHGESFGEHDYFSHGAHLYEDNVRVPLLVRWPDGRAAGTRVAAPVPNHALFAEILSAAGLPVPASAPRLDGSAPIFTEVGASDANVRMFGDFFDRSLRALYAFPLKLIESSRGRLELYDLEADPGEQRDLAAGDAKRAAALRAEVARRAATLPPLYEDAARAEMSEETERALRALGYLGDEER
ncbi:MAG TPA: sulfatase [Myxococcota bacterium]|nr:sulfatase [Myxococcota bacterium]